MSTLDLYKQRQPHTLKLELKGKPVTYRIPSEYTVNEIERLLEIQTRVDKLAKKKSTKANEDRDLNDFYEVILEQLLILFQRYQPEITISELKDLLTRNDAIRIWQFFIIERATASTSKTKKKVKKPKKS